jgi:D-serine deaminase-like pyridoxal phosphate-dependent protein
MLASITSPTLLVSERRVRDNLERMAARASRHGLQLCPHFKTHQSLVVGEWCWDYGVEEITVTSLRMAKFFAGGGWKKVAIAMPLNPREIPAIGQLAESVEMSVFLVDSANAAKLAEGIISPIGYFIEIDAGYGRSGVSWEDHQSIRAILQGAGHHQFRGFYVHSGHTYDTNSVREITEVHEELLARISALKSAFTDHGPIVAIGDTPACSTQENFRGIDRIGPGNFIYYDLTQVKLGSCKLEDIAACAAVPVVQHKGEEIVVHGGWVQLGKDSLHLHAVAPLNSGHRPTTIYGRMVLLDEEGRWDTSLPMGTVTKLSQEHGTITLPPSLQNSVKEGDLVGILPVHSCATVHGLLATGETVYLR